MADDAERYGYTRGGFGEAAIVGDMGPLGAAVVRDEQHG